jgi:hypothetical protein
METAPEKTSASRCACYISKATATQVTSERPEAAGHTSAAVMLKFREKFSFLPKLQSRIVEVTTEGEDDDD